MSGREFPLTLGFSGESVDEWAGVTRRLLEAGCNGRVRLESGEEYDFHPLQVVKATATGAHFTVVGLRVPDDRDDVWECETVAEAVADHRDLLVSLDAGWSDTEGHEILAGFFLF